MISDSSEIGIRMDENNTVIKQSTGAFVSGTAKAFYSRLRLRSNHQSAKRSALLALALSLGFLVVAGNIQAAQTYNWTNATSSGYLTDPGNWSPTVPSPPGGNLDTFTYLRTGTNTLLLTNNFSNIGSCQFGAGAAGQTLVLTLNFGTNTFAGLSGNTSSASGFTFGQTGTSIVYIAVGTMYCTNNFISPSNARFMIGRNAATPATVFLTNGTVNAGNLAIANNVTAIPSGLVVSGAGSYWSNNNTVSIGNVANANGNFLVVSNSGSMTILKALQLGFQSPSSSNSVLVDTGGHLFTRTQATIVGTGAGSSNNTMTVQGGGLWDNGNQAITIGNASGGGNSVIIGNNGVVSNVSAATIVSGNSLILSGGLFSASIGVTNNSGVVAGFGTDVGDVTFTGTGTLTPGLGTTVGTLTHSNNLTLISTSTTVVKLDKGQSGSNDFINVVSNLTEAGTLTINNTGAALVGGDTFHLFTFGTRSGDFAVTNLPSLTGTLIWNTSQLGPQGNISVVLPPSITGPGDQATNVGATVTISAVVTGVPMPSLQWQLGGVNLVDGPNAWGSTNSGSSTATLTIQNAQTNDSGSYCLIASNSASAITNCMTLTVSPGNSAPTITGPTDQNVIVNSNATFSASVAGLPSPTVQWQENGVDILDATNTSVTITNIQFSQDGFKYSIIASNSEASLTNSAYLHVVVPPAILVQPQSLTVTNTQSASFSVTYTNAVPPPTYQWQKNNIPIANATNATYTILSAAPTDMANYSVVLANVAGSVTSTNATLTVDSTMSAALTPTNGATAVCYDTPLYMAFDRVPIESGAGKISIYNVTNSVTPVDTIDTSQGTLQSRTIGTETFNTYPVIITSNTVAIYPHLNKLIANQTYFVTVDPATFTDTNGALYAGITDTNAWRFTTKSTGPTDPHNIVVATDGSGDFCTVQGAVDSLPLFNFTYTLINIRNGTYTEIVNIKSKNHVTFRGQSRNGTIVGYRNNNNNNGTTHFRMAFKVNSDDIAVENMTLVNTTPQGGSQSEALMIETGAGHFILNNAEVDSRQDTILANVNTSQGYFYNSLVQGNFDYVWGGGNLFFTNCEFRTIPTASNYNLVAPRTDNGVAGNWLGPDGHLASNGFSFVNCLLTRSSSTVSNITMSDANGSADGVAAWINCNIDITNANGYVTPAAGVLTSQILWEYNNSNLNNTVAAPLGLTVLTNGDARLLAAANATVWLNGWVPQLAPNILTNPVSVTVTAGVTAVFSVSATGVPDPSYQWVKDGTNLLNATSSTLTVSNAQDGDAGVYSVIVANSAASVTSSNATLTVVDVPPVADFSGTPTNGPTPLVVTFTDTSTGVISNRFWDFGDGNTTNTTNTTMGHTYSIGGTNTVSLTVSGPGGSSNQTLAAYITAIDTLVADFSGTPTAGVAPLLVHFTDNSAGTITNRFWDFGDGNTTNTSSTTVDYTYNAAGTNPVSLTIFGPGGSNTTNQPGYIIVTAPDTTPPQLHIDSPTDFQAFTNANITASGTASDASGLNGVTVNGVAASLATPNWSQSLTLSLGTNTITVIATDASANLNTSTQVVHAILNSVSPPTNHPPQITAGLAVTNALLLVTSNAVVVAN